MPIRDDFTLLWSDHKYILYYGINNKADPVFVNLLIQNRLKKGFGSNSK